MTTVCVAMPAYDESEGIVSFLEEIADSLRPYDVTFVVVDDCSRDTTVEEVDGLALQGFPVTLNTNLINMGHGPSTIKALELGRDSGAEIIVAIDGDGQFVGSDVRDLVDIVARGGVDVVEGVRTSRPDPGYRKISTAATRCLVWSRVGVFPRDANTPLRVYRRNALEFLLPKLPVHPMTPNLFMSALARSRSLNVAEVAVTSVPRRGVEAIGTTWGRGSLLPSRRFMSFCAAATREWFTTSIRES